MITATGRERNIMDNESLEAMRKLAATRPELFEGDNPPALVKQIGKMTYIVRVHFSETSTETFTDKVKRMLREEIQRMEP